MVESNKSTPPALARATATPTPVVPAPVTPDVPKEHKGLQHEVMDFLKQLSVDIKNASPKLPPTVSEKIDAYLKKHGNKYPETTK